MMSQSSVYLFDTNMITCCVFLQTSILNKHLQELMDGLTAKVFRTYNASITLQQQLKELTNGTSSFVQARHLLSKDV